MKIKILRLYPIFILINNINSSMFKAIDLLPGKHRSTDYDIFKTIAINISSGKTVAEVSTNLGTTDVLDVL